MQLANINGSYFTCTLQILGLRRLKVFYIRRFQLLHQSALTPDDPVIG